MYMYTSCYTYMYMYMYRVVVAQWSECRQLRSEASGSIPSGYPCIFSSVCFYPDLPPVAYHQFLPPVAVNQYSHKKNHVQCTVHAGRPKPIILLFRIS